MATKKDKAFGLRLQQLRKRKGWSQAYLGSKLRLRDKPVPAKTLGNWERGDREAPLEAVEQLTKIFGVSYDYLMGRDVPEWASPADIIKIDDILASDKEINLAYKGQLIDSEDKQNIQDMVAFYFWQKEAKVEGKNMLDNARKKNDAKE